MHRVNVWQMIQRRAKAAGILTKTNCHSFRVGGITMSCVMATDCWRRDSLARFENLTDQR